MLHAYQYWKYNHDPTSITRLLDERQLRANGRMIDHALQGHHAFVRRLHCDTTFEGHGGCVNHLRWNQSGSLLASGSDDTKVILWDYAARKQREIIHTGHTLNIFAVCFVPETNDHIIASGAMDSQVQIHYAPFREDCTKIFRLHSGRVKDIGSSYGVPKVFWSVAEDGLVYQFDVRALPKADGTTTTASELQDASGVLIRLGKSRNGRTLRGMGMATHPLDPTKIVVACGDFYTRLYDRRMLRIQKHHGPRRRAIIDAATSAGATLPAEIFAPPHLHLDEFSSDKARRRHDSAHGTSIQFSSNGSEVLANYHNDHIYLFRVGQGSAPIMKYDKNDTVPEQMEKEPWQNGIAMDQTSVRSSMSAEDVKTCHSKGLVALLGRNYSRAIKFLTQACKAACLSTLSASFQQDLLHHCAKAYLERGWNADVYLAAAFCKQAMATMDKGADTREIELTYIKALHKDQRLKQAHVAARKYQAMYPVFASDVEDFVLHDDDHDQQTARSEHQRLLDRIHIRFSHSDDDDDHDENEQAEVHHTTQSDGNEPSSDHEPEYSSTSGRSSSSSLNDASESTTTRRSDPSDDAGFWSNPRVDGVHVNCDVERRYIGYCNVQTDIKEATFFGKDDAIIIAGSDDGRAYMWDKCTGALVNCIKADENIVNCVQSHPIDSCLATSGIENVIRLWTPTNDGDNAPSDDQFEELVADNQREMANMYEQYYGESSSNLIRLIFQSGHQEGIQECATS